MLTTKDIFNLMEGFLNKFVENDKYEKLDVSLFVLSCQNEHTFMLFSGYCIANDIPYNEVTKWLDENLESMFSRDAIEVVTKALKDK